MGGGAGEKASTTVPLCMDIINGGSKNAFPLEFRAFLYLGHSIPKKFNARPIFHPLLREIFGKPDIQFCTPTRRVEFNVL